MLKENPNKIPTSANADKNVIDPIKSSDVQNSLDEKSNQEKKTEKIIEERRVIEYRTKRGGCLGTGIGCNVLGCLFILLLLFCCAGFIFIIVSRPPVIWDRVVDYLNTGLHLPDYHPSSADYVQESIVSNLKNGQNDIYISEDQLTTIARDKLTQFKDLTFDIENGELLMYWALDNSNKPVYAQIKLETKNNSVKISKIGTPNLSLPEFTNEALNSLILSVLNLNTSDGNGNLIDTILNNGGNIKINKVEFQKDKIYLDIYITVDLFN